MLKCKDCALWDKCGTYGICNRIDEDVGSPDSNSAMIRVKVCDDSGLEVRLLTGPDFGCALAVEKKSRTKKEVDVL